MIIELTRHQEDQQLHTTLRKCWLTPPESVPDDKLSRRRCNCLERGRLKLKMKWKNSGRLTFRKEGGARRKVWKKKKLNGSRSLVECPLWNIVSVIRRSESPDNRTPLQQTCKHFSFWSWFTVPDKHTCEIAFTMIFLLDFPLGLT